MNNCTWDFAQTHEHVFPVRTQFALAMGRTYSAYNNPQNTPLQPLLLCRPSRLSSAADACQYCSRLGFPSSTSLSLELRSLADDLAAAMLQSSSEKSPSCSSKKLRQACQSSLSLASACGKWLCVRIGLHLSRAEKMGCFMFLARETNGQGGIHSPREDVGMYCKMGPRLTFSSSALRV